MKDKKLTPFGRYIKKRLIDRDMTQVDLANAIGTTPPMVTYIIYGQRDGEKWKNAIYRALGDTDKAEKFENRRRA